MDTLRGAMVWGELSSEFEVSHHSPRGPQWQRGTRPPAAWRHAGLSFAVLRANQNNAAIF